MLPPMDLRVRVRFDIEGVEKLAAISELLEEIAEDMPWRSDVREAREKLEEVIDSLYLEVTD